jgi:hypothetical protein
LSQQIAAQYLRLSKIVSAAIQPKRNLEACSNLKTSMITSMKPALGSNPGKNCGWRVGSAQVVIAE